MPKKNARTEAVPATLQEAAEYFADPNVCLAYMVAMRWPNGEIACPACGSHAVRFIPRRNGWQCGSHHANRTFSVKTGTVMEDSPIPLKKWLLGIWLIVNCKNGVSSYEVARDLDITQKSAWFLLQRIRLALQEGSLMKLGGPGGDVVEVDETFIGGKSRLMNAKQRKKSQIAPRPGPLKPRSPQKAKRTYSFTSKAIVMGMLERGGKVVAKVVKTTSKGSLLPNITKHIEPKSEVHTDENPAYAHLAQGEAGDYLHQIIDHATTYVNGNVHTNSIENFWSLLKRGLRGTYISVEPFHLFRYLDEQMFRFNNRETTDQGRFLAALARIGGKRLTYSELIGAELEAHSPA